MDILADKLASLLKPLQTPKVYTHTLVDIDVCGSHTHKVKRKVSHAMVTMTDGHITVIVSATTLYRLAKSLHGHTLHLSLQNGVLHIAYPSGTLELFDLGSKWQDHVPALLLDDGCLRVTNGYLASRKETLSEPRPRLLVFEYPPCNAKAMQVHSLCICKWRAMVTQRIHFGLIACYVGYTHKQVHATNFKGPFTKQICSII